MLWIVLPLIAALGGIIHTITGFGSGIVMMLFLPSFLDMASAPALSSSINLFLSLILAFKFRKTIRIRLFLLPIIPYLMGSTMAIYALSGFDMRLVAISFGVFLIILSLYFTFVAKKMTVTPNWQTAVFCGAISGVTAGLFGIGGPLMAVYFVSASDGKESYIANLQFLFALTNVVNFFTRIYKGFYTFDLVPVTLLGFAGITLGKKLGLKILDRLDLESMKKGVYLFVGISGILNVIQQL